MTQPVKITEADRQRYEAMIAEMSAKKGAASNDEVPGGAWYVVTTNPNSEHRACWSIGNAGIYFYFPQMRRWAVHARKRRVVERPLFPRYMFVFLRADQSFYALRKCHGVAGVLCADGQPYAIKGRNLDFLNAIMAQEGDGEFDDTKEIVLPAKGDRMKIQRGPYADLPVIIHEAKDERRIEVLLTLLGGERLTTVTFADLAPAREVCT